MDWKGNFLTPAGMARRHRLHSTTNSLRSWIPNAIGIIIGEYLAKVQTCNPGDQAGVFVRLDKPDFSEQSASVP
jgi:hypothetical protein